jgi:DNA invertase Pin-like site-specific DNA recombinase
MKSNSIKTNDIDTVEYTESTYTHVHNDHDHCNAIHDNANYNDDENYEEIYRKIEYRAENINNKNNNNNNSKRKNKHKNSYTIHEMENIMDDKVDNGVNMYKIKWIGLKKMTWINENDFIELDMLNDYKKYKENRLKEGTKKGYIYCRTSKRNSDVEVSLANQEKVCLEYAQNNNIDVVGVIVDNGVSARKMKNQIGLNHILENVKDGDAIICNDVSRFSRSFMEAVSVLENLRERNVYVHAIVDGVTWNEIATMRYNFRQILSVSQLYSDIASEKIKTSIKHIRDSGSHVGHVPYGYTRIIDRYGTRKLVKNNEENDVINLIIDEYKKQVNVINDEKIANDNGKRKRSTKNVKTIETQPYIIDETPNATSDALKMIKLKKRDYEKIADLINQNHKYRYNRYFTPNIIKKIIKNWHQES